MKSLIGKELTRKGEDKLYLILYSKPENGIIELPCSFEKKMVKAHMLHNKESIKTTQLKAQNKCLIDVSSICIEQTPVVIKLKGNGNSNHFYLLDSISWSYKRPTDGIFHIRAIVSLFKVL